MLVLLPNPIFLLSWLLLLLYRFASSKKDPIYASSTTASENFAALSASLLETAGSSEAGADAGPCAGFEVMYFALLFAMRSS
jgi:hypothetical protein